MHIKTTLRRFIFTPIGLWRDVMLTDLAGAISWQPASSQPAVRAPAIRHEKAISLPRPAGFHPSCDTTWPCCRGRCKRPATPSKSTSLHPPKFDILFPTDVDYPPPMTPGNLPSLSASLSLMLMKRIVVPLSNFAISSFTRHDALPDIRPDLGGGSLRGKIAVINIFACGAFGLHRIHHRLHPFDRVVHRVHAIGRADAKVIAADQQHGMAFGRNALKLAIGNAIEEYLLRAVPGDAGPPGLPAPKVLIPVGLEPLTALKNRRWNRPPYTDQYCRPYLRRHNRLCVFIHPC